MAVCAKCIVLVSLMHGDMYQVWDVLVDNVYKEDVQLVLNVLKRAGLFECCLLCFVVYCFVFY